MVFDSERAIFKGPDQFKRFNVTGDGVSLNKANLKPKGVLLVFERGGERRALLQEQMVYHHVAQGELAGEPYPKRSIGEGIDDEIDGRPLRIHVGEDAVPVAKWDNGSRPLQLFTRWYGFSYTYPDCEVWGESEPVKKAEP